MSSILDDLELRKIPSNDGLLEEYLLRVGLEIGIGPLDSDSNTGGLESTGLAGGGLDNERRCPRLENVGLGFENFLLGGGECLCGGGEEVRLGGGLELDLQEDGLLLFLLGLLETGLK